MAAEEKKEVKKAVNSLTKSEPMQNEEKNPEVVSFAKRKEFSSVDVVSGSIKLAIKYFGVLAMIIGIPVIISDYTDIQSAALQASGNTLPTWIDLCSIISNLVLMFLGIGTLLVIAKKESGEEITSVSEYMDIIFKQAVLRVPKLLLVGLIFVGVAAALVSPVFIYAYINASFFGFFYMLVISVVGVYLSAKYGQAFTAVILTPKYSKLFQFSANITKGKILRIIIAGFLLFFVVLIPSLVSMGVTFLAKKYGAAIMPGIVLAIISACFTIITIIISTAFQYNIFMKLRSVYCDEDERI